MDPPLQRQPAIASLDLGTVAWRDLEILVFPNVEKKMPIEVQLAGKAKEAVAAAIVSAQEWKLPLQSFVEKDVQRQSWKTSMLAAAVDFEYHH